MPTPAPSPARAALDKDVSALIALWDACDLTRAHNHAPTDIAFARGRPNSDVLVIEDDAQIIASVLVGHDGHRGWVYYVAVHPGHRHRGLGRHIMAEAERWLLARGIWKMQLMMRRANESVQRFYEALGFADDQVTIFSKRLKPMPYIDPKAPALGLAGLDLMSALRPYSAGNTR